jgi:hypothetical protein
VSNTNLNASAPAEQAPNVIPFPARRPQRSPDKQRSLARRRTLGTGSPMPPHFRQHFTIGEEAVLNVIREDIRAKGLCDRYIDGVAALAGVSRRTAQNALRHAERAGLITIEERRRKHYRNRTNIIRVISQEVRAWWGISGGVGAKNCTPRRTERKEVSKNSATHCIALTRDADAKVQEEGLPKESKPGGFGYIPAFDMEQVEAIKDVLRMDGIPRSIGALVAMCREPGLYQTEGIDGRALAAMVHCGYLVRDKRGKLHAPEQKEAA